MTTLELAENVAKAVLDESGARVVDPRHRRTLAVAVLRCLQEHNSWFCRLEHVETPDGPLDVGSTPYERVQTGVV